jgi:hypothetical protein
MVVGSLLPTQGNRDHHARRHHPHHPHHPHHATSG